MYELNIFYEKSCKLVKQNFFVFIDFLVISISQRFVAFQKKVAKKLLNRSIFCV